MGNFGVDVKMKKENVKNKSISNKTDKTSLRNGIEKKLDEKSDDLFADIEEIIFLKNKEKKLIGRLQNGKYVLLNKSENPETVEPGLPYICSIRNLENVAFAKIIASVFIPRIILGKMGILIVYKSKNKGEVNREIMENVASLKEKIKEEHIEKLICIIRDEYFK